MGKAAHRDAAFDLRLQRRGHGGKHVGLGVARRDRVDRNAGMHQFGRSGPGEGDDAALAGAVVGLAHAPESGRSSN